MRYRGVDKQFLEAMRDKLDEGRRKGYVGYDQYWGNCIFPEPPLGASGCFMKRLQQEVNELVVAIIKGDTKAIRHEAADVANFAMFIADIHGSLSLKEEQDHAR